MDEELIESAGGSVAVRWYPSARAHGAGVVLVGGVGGGFDTPARRLYERLAAELPEVGISVLRVRFRHPGDLVSAVDDVLAGIDLLARRGLPRVALVGHSFGGAVAIRAAVRSTAVAGVATLSTQSYGADEVGQLRRPVLLVHGTADPVLPTSCSISLARIAGAHARLELMEDAGHTLDETAEEVRTVLVDWLRLLLPIGPPSDASGARDRQLPSPGAG